MSVFAYFCFVWLTIAAGTFFFLSVLVVSAFKHGGLRKFQQLNVSLPALVVIVIIMSILFPIAWVMITQLIKGARS